MIKVAPCRPDPAMSSSQLGFERLFELERGLRSTSKQDQLKALNKIPDFIEDWNSNADVIEACLLRVLDYFKARSMERKVETVQFVESTLTSIMRILKFKSSEIIKRLVAMWELEDPLMKTLVLRWIFVFQAQLANSPDIFYRVGQSLMSGIREEYTEAIRVYLSLASLTNNSMLIRGTMDSVLYRLERLSNEKRALLLEAILKVTYPDEEEFIKETFIH